MSFLPGSGSRRRERFVEGRGIHKIEGGARVRRLHLRAMNTSIAGATERSEFANGDNTITLIEDYRI